jgi:hypothetical protein
MANLTQLGSNLFLGSTYSVVVWTDDNGQTWVAHHTDKSRSYKTDWGADEVRAAIEGSKTLTERLQERYTQGKKEGQNYLIFQHNKLPWWKRVRKKKL